MCANVGIRARLWYTVSERYNILSAAREMNISFINKLGPIESEESPTILDAVRSSPQTANLAAQVDLDAFQAALIGWVCLAHSHRLKLQGGRELSTAGFYPSSCCMHIPRSGRQSADAAALPD